MPKQNCLILHDHVYADLLDDGVSIISDSDDEDPDAGVGPGLGPGLAGGDTSVHGSGS